MGQQVSETHPFKVNDVVVALCDGKSGTNSYYHGHEYRATRIHSSSGYDWIDVVATDGSHSVNGTYADHYALKESNRSLMTNVISTIKKITRQEPEKSLVEAGLLDENENITDEGRDALTYILWEQNKTELKKLADQINEENAPKKK